VGQHLTGVADPFEWDVGTMGAVQMGRWSRQEYERMADVGVLRHDERTELIDGGSSRWRQSTVHTRRALG
jgi:hypothetical protein